MGNLLNNRMIEAGTRLFCKLLTVTPHLGGGVGCTRFMHFEDSPDGLPRQGQSLLKTVFFQWTHPDLPSIWMLNTSTAVAEAAWLISAGPKIR